MWIYSSNSKYSISLQNFSRRCRRRLRFDLFFFIIICCTYVCIFFVIDIAKYRNFISTFYLLHKRTWKGAEGKRKICKNATCHFRYYFVLWSSQTFFFCVDILLAVFMFSTLWLWMIFDFFWFRLVPLDRYTTFGFSLWFSRCCVTRFVVECLK